MIIDFHTHTFPEKIAKKALDKLSANSGTPYYTKGTVSALKNSMERCHVDKSVLLPVVTDKSQLETINKTALNLLETEPSFIPFGGIHPDNENYREVLRMLANNGIKGIKLHPVFQNVNFDDIRYLRLVECACENDLIVTIHAGYDIGYPRDCDQAVPHRIRALIDQVHPDKLVLAHMGGWHCLDEVKQLLAGLPVYFDTAFTQLSDADFCELVKLHGDDKILFGTDSPWADQAEDIQKLRSCELDAETIEKILWKNAAKLLKLT